MRKRKRKRTVERGASKGILILMREISRGA